MKRIIGLFSAFVLAWSLAGCNKLAGNKAESQGQASASTDTLASAREALEDHNFLIAADRAARAADADPHNPAVRLLQAEAEAQLSNAGSAAKALGQALDLGLPNATAAVANPLFDPVRRDIVFRTVAERAEGAAGNRSPGIASGDVSIGPDGSVRAGSVSIAGDR